MKILAVAFLAFFLVMNQVHAEDSQVLKTPKDKVSYIIGIDIGKAFKKQGLDIDSELLVKGIKDSLAGDKFLLGEQEIREIMAGLQQKMAAQEAEQRKKLMERNKMEGEAFLAENKKKAGVQTLPSGLQYKIIRPGTGKKPQKTDTVSTHYRGTLIDGTEFDSSYRRGKPASFSVGGVIPGWTEALQLMEEGAKWQLFLPANLAYGERGAGREIGPHAVLIFEVELISVQASQ
jgi:FKBP-type peptidyl-prolyl cis-trans isomerase FklB